MSADTPEVGRFGRVEIVAAERRLVVDGRAVALGARAFDLLAALVARRDRIVAKDELIELVWPGLVVEENNLQVQVSALRKVLGAQAIATVPGRGYQFTLSSGAAAAAAAPTTAPAAAPAPGTGSAVAPRVAGAPARLLVADDNKVNRLLLCRSLELMGHAVRTAEDGRRALAMLRAEPFELLLLDLEMPELDGFGLLEARAADAALREVPVIVTSSLEGVAGMARCIELGADDFLHKPVNSVLLKARVESSLERKHLRDRQRELLARLAPEVDASVPAQGRAIRARSSCLAICVRGLEALAERLPAEALLELLDQLATLAVEAIESRGGRVHTLAGGEIGAVFPAEGGAARAAADELLELAALLGAERQARGEPAVEIGVGVAEGEVVSGVVGTSRRAAYACIGAAVKRARERAREARGELRVD